MTSIEHTQLFKVFSESFSSLDIGAIAQLLHENGEFETIDNDTQLSKNDFVKWLKNEFAARLKQDGYQTLKSTIDRCIGCEFNCKVVLFEDGYFPSRKPKVGYKMKNAFLPKFIDGKITNIKICSTFLETENRYSRPSDFDDEIPF